MSSFEFAHEWEDVVVLVFKVLVGLAVCGVISELVLAHSLQCPGCDANARTSLRLWMPGRSDAHSERCKQETKMEAARRRAQRAG